MNNIKIKKLTPEAVIPKKAHYNDAGYDMIATSIEHTEKYIQYGTGIAMEIPDGMVGLIFPRSSVTNKDLMLKNCVGVIDAGYRNEISFRFYKIIVEEKLNRFEEYDTTNGYLKTLEGKALKYKFEKDQDIYKIKDKIGQIIFLKLPNISFIETNKLNDSERGKGGYGSTDKPEKTNIRTVPESYSPPKPPEDRILKEGEIPIPPTKK